MAAARDLAADLLLRHERQGGRVREGLDAALGRVDDPRDRGLLTELAYGVARRQGTLDAVLGAFSRRPVARLASVVLVALRLGLYQALFLDRVPPHAAVDHAVGWARRLAGPERAGFVNGVLRAVLRAVEGPAVGRENPRRDVPRENGAALRLARDVFPDPAADLAANLAARHGMPAWLVEGWLAQWGESRCASILRAGLARPPMTLRVRGDLAEVEEALAQAGLAFERGGVPTALRLEDGEAARRFVLARADVVVQDETSQRVVPLLGLRPGERVLDLCAAPGGKTLHAADLLGRGELTACDVTEEKVALLEALRAKMGAGIDYRVQRLEPGAPLPFPEGCFDAILVDAPCTNTGVLRRRVEARWRLQPEDVLTLSGLQVDLLTRCVPVLAPGGRIVYSTCSVERDENLGTCARFWATHPDFVREPGFTAFPSSAADGGYAAILRRSVSGSP